ncbi:MAG: hypothetical protein A7316_05855 [Candidatus Altiarchaeales archaeon WOR_SM1_86-2]|nr:MAG: hypothetical protein A7316_05855 [Candidatus Altiarchaeales archaeon WOR_SM1_86-2]
MEMEREGAFYGMDHVPLKVRKFIEQPFDFAKSDAYALERLLERIKELGRIIVKSPTDWWMQSIFSFEFLYN